jgi:hypothetical protein
MCSRSDCDTYDTPSDAYSLPSQSDSIMPVDSTLAVRFAQATLRCTIATIHLVGVSLPNTTSGGSLRLRAPPLLSCLRTCQYDSSSWAAFVCRCASNVEPNELWVPCINTKNTHVVDSGLDSSPSYVTSFAACPPVQQVSCQFDAPTSNYSCVRSQQESADLLSAIVLCDELGSDDSDADLRSEASQRTSEYEFDNGSDSELGGETWPRLEEVVPRRSGLHANDIVNRETDTGYNRLTSEALSELAREFKATQGLRDMSSRTPCSSILSGFSQSIPTDVSLETGSEYSINEFNIETNSESSEGRSSTMSELDADGLWNSKLDRYQEQEPGDDQGWPERILQRLQEDSEYFEDTEKESPPVDVYGKYNKGDLEYATPLYEDHPWPDTLNLDSPVEVTRLKPDSVLATFLSELRGEKSVWLSEALDLDRAESLVGENSADGYYFINGWDIEEAASEPCVLHADFITNNVRASETPAVTPEQLTTLKSSIPVDEKKKGKKYKPVDKKIRPVDGVRPMNTLVETAVPEDPALTLPPLSSTPPDFTPTGRFTEERMKMMDIDKNTHLWPEEKKLFKHILVLNEKAFAWGDDERGIFRRDWFSDYKFAVVDHKPWFFKNIPIPPAYKEAYMKLIKEKIDAGVYEPSQSSYRSRWFCVAKKNGKFRLVHDMQPLNAVSIRDAGQPPVLDEFVESFAGHLIFTALDMYSGYDARTLHPESRYLTAWESPYGPLQHTCLPQGYTNAVAVYQAIMNKILELEIRAGTCRAFIDDVAIKGQETPRNGTEPTDTLTENPGIRTYIWNHAVDVHRIIHRVKCAGGTFSGKKGQIGVREVLITGQVCNTHGRVPDTDKISKIIKWPVPTCVTDVRGFGGLAGTMRVWIENYSNRMRPLVKLTKKNAVFAWNEDCNRAFNEIKKAITRAPILRPINYQIKNRVILMVDSSMIAAGFILGQESDEGRFHPARYGSRPMNERESRYSQAKLELYGLFIALKTWRIYLSGVQFTVFMDAQYVIGMLKSFDPLPSAAENRWKAGIQMFDMRIEHKPAAQMKAADALSRRTPTAEEMEALKGLERKEELEGEWSENIGLLVHAPLFIKRQPCYQGIDLPSYQLEMSEQLDPEERVRSIRDFLLTGNIPELDGPKQRQRFLMKTRRYKIVNDQLYRQHADGADLKVIFDPQKRRDLLKQVHDGYGHRGVHAVFETLKHRFWWPYMFQDIKHHIATCHECQIRSTVRLAIPPTVSQPATIFQKIYLDVMHMPTAQGYKYIVAARDDLSQAAEGRALKTANSITVSKFLWEEIICRYGAIGVVVTDNGPEVQKAFEILVEKYNLPQVKISAYNSPANGVVERGHYIIREALVKACEGNINRWPNLVHHTFFADKIMPRKATGFSPFYLLYGIDPVLPFDLTEVTYLVDGFYAGMDSVDLLALRIRQLEKRPSDLAKAAESIIAQRVKNKAQFEKRYRRLLRKEDYEPGELVIVQNSSTFKSHNRKHKARYLGPLVVERKTIGGSYVLKDLDGTINRRSVAARRLLPYHSRGDLQLDRIEKITKDSLGEDSDTVSIGEDTESEEG